MEISLYLKGYIQYVFASYEKSFFILALKLFFFPKIFKFHNLKFRSVIKCVSIKQEIGFNEYVGEKKHNAVTKFGRFV